MTPETGAEPNGEVRRPSPVPGGADRWPPSRALLAFAACALICTAVYLPALNGEFVSDDISYLVNNPFVNELTFENLAAVFDVRSSEKSYTGNYAPVDELLMAFERRAFGDRLWLYHALNLAFHCAASVLLVGWLRDARLPATSALLGGLCFALHPANVEAVAWMSQLKTVAALAFSLAALRALPRAPALATALFVTGLLTKASALFALPTAAVAAWVQRGGGRRWAWIGVWAALFALYAVPEFGSFRHFGAAVAPPYATAGEQWRSMAAYGARYLWMAASGLGLSAFHEPPPATSFLDPWWLAALPLLGLLAWRVGVAARRRSEELVFWVAAAAGYAPVSQIFPFVYPMGDRYLYFVLPGLIGAALCVLGDVRDALAARFPARATPAALSRAGVALALAAAVGFGVRAHQRAAIWRHETRLFLDAERHYPHGGPAGFLQARRAAQRGDAAAAVAALERAEARGLANFMLLPNDRALAPIAGTPEFRDFIRDMARRWVERSLQWGPLNQAQAHMQAHAYLILDEPRAARDSLERAIAAGGPQDAELRAELDRLRRRLEPSGDAP